MGQLNLNRATIAGRLGRDVELRATSGGKSVANFSIATSSSYKNANGEWVENPPEWHKIVVWGKQAESAANYLHKGSECYVEGRIVTRDYTDKDGIKRYSTEIVAEKILWPKSGSGGGSASHGSGGGEFDGYSEGSSGGSTDDIPF